MRAEGVAAADGAPRTVTARNSRTFRATALILGVLAVAGTAWWSLFVGAGGLDPTQVVSALQHPDGGEMSTIVWEMRMPRALTALLVGAALGAAGAIMQNLTRNPLADPGLLGVSAGAGFAVIVAVGFIGVTSFDRYLWFALGGAFAVSVLVYVISITVGRNSPLTLVLAGVAITAVLTGISTALALLDPARFNALRNWMAGNVAGRDLDTIGQGATIIILGFVVAAIVARPLSQLGLGDDIARSLGVPVGAARLGAAIAVMLLAGAGTALAGPILFIGLMVPHVARVIVGHRGGWNLAVCAVVGALLLLVADMVGRVVVLPAEAPAGLLTAILGAPVLAMLARSRGETR